MLGRTGQNFDSVKDGVCLVSNIRSRPLVRSSLVALILAGIAACGSPAELPSSSTTQSALEEGFQQPPPSAKPHVWWHWMNGNITKEGIKLDLEWMQRVGIGGVQNFDASMYTPKVVDNPLIYMTSEWKDSFKFAVETAAELGLDFAIAASPGFSETGGPWVEAEHGMKKLVWSEVDVQGNQPFDGTLPKPPTTSGPFMDFEVKGEELFGKQRQLPEFYADVAVVAVPVWTDGELPQPRVETHSGPISGEELFDSSLQTSVKLDVGDAQHGWLQFDWQDAQAISSVSLSIEPKSHYFDRAPIPVLEAETTAGIFEQIAVFPTSSNPQVTLSFNPVTTSSLRIVFTPNQDETQLMSASAPGATIPEDFGARTREISILDARFYSEPRVHRFEAKAGFATEDDYYKLERDENVPGVSIGKIVDLTEDFTADGRIDWEVPEGRWRILRIGYSLTGKENHPATLEATGLEVDKYDEHAVRKYINEYLDMYVGAVGSENVGQGGITGLLNDSFEAGLSNWTPDMMEEFRRRRGYDMRPWLPALTGVIVESSSKTDAFLYDFRATLAEMLADNHYAIITEEVNKRGLTHYSEALEHGRPTLGDGMAMRRTVDVPMAAMWTFDADEQIGPAPQYWSDIREAASVAHVYGQNLVAAESLTSIFAPWAYAPRDLQPMMDMEFALGVNRPIIHTSVHQPLSEKAPGFSLMVFGQYFNRLDTWAELAEPWVTYMSRSAYLLQQGRFVADVAYFYGQEAPLTQLFLDAPPTDVPIRHGFDYINADIILNELKNDGGEVVTEGGARYKVIYLGGTSSKMTLPVLKQLAQLVHNGAVVVGLKPEASPALQDDSETFARIANDLWSGKTGKGKVVAIENIDQALDKLGITADFAHSYPIHDTTIMFVHRTLPNADIYYFTNRKNRPEQVQLQFRVTGKKPELWDAATGTVSPISYRTDGDHTVIPMNLRAHESGFIVFREPTAKTQATVKEPVVQQLEQLSGEWVVEFQSGRGVDSGTYSMGAGDWTQSKVPGVPHFSGTATYEKTIKIPARKDQSRLVLNLGEVGDLAEVFVNDESAGITWKPPYRVDITELAKPGENQIRIEVTNLWVNRLIGDAQPDAEQITFTTVATYEKDAPLRPSGLIGPVVLERVSRP